MTETVAFEDRIAEQLRAYAAPAARPPRREAVTNAVEAARNVHGGIRGGLTWPTLGRPSMAVAAGAAAVVLAVVGIGFLSSLPNQPIVGVPVATQTPTPTGAPTATPDPSSSPDAQPATSGSMWPQSSQDEVIEAQGRADAGDPDYTWQVDPSWSIDFEPLIGTEISERFLREGLGWEAFMPVSSAWYMAAGGPDINRVAFIRCASGRTNPLSSLYPDMEPEFRACAPTLDDFRYETVSYSVGQPARSGPSGIWVVTAWEMLQPGEQAAPPSEADVTALLQSFLGARLDGEGAEEYMLARGEVEALPFVDGEAPLLHATTGGSRYERSEIERLQGPFWPAGWIESKVRLFAEDGTVVEQHFVVVRQENGRLGLVYGPESEYGDPPTIDNGQALYSLLDGEVTFVAAPNWRAWLAGPTRMHLEFGCQGTGFCSDNVVAVADPPVVTGCEAGPAPADADALARSIRSNPDLESTTPVAVNVGGIDALRMDVAAAPGAGVCETSLVVTGASLRPTDRMRLYLVDLPGGSARVLAIAVIARDPYDEVQVPQQDFEQLVEAATPIVESIQFHTP
jgi:hypothetical protein